MSKKFLLSGLVLAVAGMCSSAFAQDVGRVRAVGDVNLGTALAGQDGSLNTSTSFYQLSTLGTAPAGITNTPQYANGTDLLVTLDVNSSSSFTDFITFKVPANTNTTTTATAFNLSVLTFLSLFTYYDVKLYSGAPKFTANTPLLGHLTFGGTGTALPTTTGSFDQNLSFGVDYYLEVNGTAVTGGISPTYNLQLVAAPIPEPGTFATLMAGLAALGFMVKRRKNSI